MDPDNELYDAACDLLAAAERVRQASGGTGIAPAVPATLGCVESALAALAEACTALALQAHDGAYEPFESLVLAVRAAETACGELRPRSGDRPGRDSREPG
jgi:hypothetical protein